MSTNERVIILGAAGRDFHDFQVYWSLQPNVDVVCFTAKQIPGIDNRMFPPEMCKNEENGNKYPNVSEMNCMPAFLVVSTFQPSITGLRCLAALRPSSLRSPLTTYLSTNIFHTTHSSRAS